MDIKNIISDSTNTLNTIYQKLNAQYYNNELPQVVITIQASPKGKYYGWFGAKFWEKKNYNKVEKIETDLDDDTADVNDAEDAEDAEDTNSSNSDSSVEKFHEINISAEYLARSITEIFATMNHEMVHLYCFLNDIQDTSNHNVYHNKKFKIEAEKRDLEISKAKTIGWSVTNPTDNFKKFVNDSGIPENTFEYFRILPPKKSASSSNSQVRYVCPNCNAKFRAKRGLSVHCNSCDCDFISD